MTVVLLVCSAPAAAAARQRGEAPQTADWTGQEIYRAACATCHGPDGRGSPRSLVGFAVALPDFTDCAFATAEADADWVAVVHEGGRVRGLDRHMPAFGGALSTREIRLVVNYLRTLCPEPAWPRGDLNFPRAFFTEKAFPENEAVWVTAIDRGDDAAVGNELIYERRLGRRAQIEIAAPIDFQKTATGSWVRGLGDVAVAVKRTFYASIERGRIAAGGAEIVLPTGEDTVGLGDGVVVLEPFAMWGQALPKNTFVQMHGGAELPVDPSKKPREFFLRSALGATFAGDRGFGRSWSPQVELLWARPQGEPAEWDVVPQVQITLSKLQHVVVAGGVRIPVTGRSERRAQVVTYLLWDWFDGSLFDFWR